MAAVAPALRTACLTTEGGSGDTVKPGEAGDKTAEFLIATLTLALVPFAARAELAGGEIDPQQHSLTQVDSYGVQSRLVPSPEGNKANLYASIGPMVEGGVVLSGHTDVVPVEGQNWTTDPWTLTEKNGRLYGRGSADDYFVLSRLCRHIGRRRLGLRRGRGPRPVAALAAGRAALAERAPGDSALPPSPTPRP